MKREKGYQPYHQFRRPKDKFQPGDAVRKDPGIASRETIMDSLQIVLDELKNEKLSLSEVKDIKARANKLRNLLGWPSQ